MSEVRVGSLTLGANHPLALIAGPCVIEDETHALRHAEAIARIAAAAGWPLIFKASYDKANRSSGKSFRGPGAEEGLSILERVRGETGLAVVTDVHETGEVAATAEVVDLIQVPAFLCRQTSLLETAARSGKPVNVKKGQFLAPWDARHIVDKVHGAGGQCLITERGSSFGYSNLVVDYRSLVVLQELGLPVVFDATHSVQLPGGGPGGDSTGGQREFVPPLCRAAIAAGCDALFLEVHEAPDQAPCDGPNMWPLHGLPSLLAELARWADTAGRR